MDDPNEAQHNMNLALRFLTLLEDYELQNSRLKTFIWSLPMAQEPGFSLDDLLAETGLAGDSERDLRARYDEVRGMLLGIVGSEERLRKVLEHIQATKRLS